MRIDPTATLGEEAPVWLVLTPNGYTPTQEESEELIPKPRDQVAASAKRRATWAAKHEAQRLAGLDKMH
jgi:hypothetical protein